MPLLLVAVSAVVPIEHRSVVTADPCCRGLAAEFLDAICKQTLKGINAGLTLNDIVTSLVLPTELMKRPYLVMHTRRQGVDAGSGGYSLLVVVGTHIRRPAVG